MCVCVGKFRGIRGIRGSGFLSGCQSCMEGWGVGMQLRCSVLLVAVAQGALLHQTSRNGFCSILHDTLTGWVLGHVGETALFSSFAVFLMRGDSTYSHSQVYHRCWLVISRAPFLHDAAKCLGSGILAIWQPHPPPSPPFQPRVAKQPHPRT